MTWGPSWLAGRITWPRQWIAPADIELSHPRLTDGPRTGSRGARPTPGRALAPETPKVAQTPATNSRTADRRAQRAATWVSITSTSRGEKWNCPTVSDRKTARRLPPVRAWRDWPGIP